MTADRGPLAEGVLIAMLTLGGVFVFARVITRSIIRPQLFSWDDGLIVVTWFTILGYSISMFVSIGKGYGKHIAALSSEQASQAMEAEVIGQFFAICSFPPGKASIAYLLQRIFPSLRLRWFVWSFVVANTLLFYIDAILILTQCHPVAYQWDQSIKGGSCWSSSVVIDFGFLTGVVGAITDLVFAIVPWLYIRNLNMPLREKAIVGIALSMGLFACACSIMKIYYTWTLGTHDDFTFDTVPLVIWSCVELGAINIAACIPTLRPLYLWLSGKYARGPKSQSATYGSRISGGTGIRLGLFTNRTTRIDSLDDSEQSLNIYRHTTYDVTVKDREDDQSAILGQKG